MKGHPPSMGSGGGGGGGSGGGGGLFDRIRNLDAFPKAQGDDLWVRTNAGASVSVCAMVCISILFVSEFWFFLSTETVEVMQVDDVRNAKMQVHFDVTFPYMACSVVSLDAMDVSGAHQMDVLANVYKKRLDSDGKPFGASDKNELRDTVTTTEQLLGPDAKTKDVEGNGGDTDGDGGAGAPAGGADAKDAGDAGDAAAEAADDGNGEPECGSCYGAGAPGQCCSTCEEIRGLYRKKGWAFHASTVKQCQQEGFIDDVEANSGEGCNFYGYIEVPKVQGNLHFAPGRSFTSANSHVHDLLEYTVGQINLTHTVNRLSFGKPYPDMTNPLDGRTVVAQQSGMFQYYITVVPTTFEYRMGAVLDTNQFSVTEHFRKFDAAGSSGLPGVFFFYEISPIRADIIQRGRSFLHFLTRVCAIMGGVFTVLGLIDKAVHEFLMHTGKGHSGLAR